jgi:FixJ family two-component response regulator
MTMTSRQCDAVDPSATAASVLFVDDDDDLRGLFVEMVGAFLARRCVAVGSYEQLVQLGDDALRCPVAVLDINLGQNQPSGIDVYAWLRSRGYRGRIVFLTAHASSHPLVVEAQRLGGAEILSKPIDPERLISLLEESIR